MWRTDNGPYFPTAKNLAYLSNAVYGQKFGSRNVYKVNQQNSSKEIALEGTWQLLATAESTIVGGAYIGFGDGYNGAAYYDETNKHLVIVHRGTKLTNLGALWADVRSIYLNKYTSYMKSAYLFTRLIVNQFQSKPQSISLTGHSLGGWLCQMSAFFMKYPKFCEDFISDADFKKFHQLSMKIVDTRCEGQATNSQPSVHIHVVVFDSPGSLHMVDSYLDKENRYVDGFLERRTKILDSLDITAYLSSPNVINSCNLHIGSLFLMQGITATEEGQFSWYAITWEGKFLEHTFTSHSIERIMQFWQQEDWAENVRKIIDWPQGLGESNACLPHRYAELTCKRFQFKRVNPLETRISVFTAAERDFLEDIQYLREYAFKENTTLKNLFHEHGKMDKFGPEDAATATFTYFNSFKISRLAQVLRITSNNAGGHTENLDMNRFITVTKCLAGSPTNFPELAKNVIENTPALYEAIYQKFSNEYVSRLPGLQNHCEQAFLRIFLESSNQIIHQTITKQSTFICVAKVYRELLNNERQYNFFGGGAIRFEQRNILFLSVELLITLHRHVNVKRIVPPRLRNDLKLIVLEIESPIPLLNCEPMKILIQQYNNAATCKLLIISRELDLSQLIQTNYTISALSGDEDKISFLDVTEKQRQKIMNQELCFQETNIPLGSLIDVAVMNADPNFLTCDTLTRILRNTVKDDASVIKLGNAIPALSKFEESYYIPRKFNRIFVNCRKEIAKRKLRKLPSIDQVIIIEYDEDGLRNKVMDFFFPGRSDSASSFFQLSNEPADLAQFDLKKHQFILVNTVTTMYDTIAEHFSQMKGYWFKVSSNLNQWELVATFGEVNMGSLDVDHCEEYDETELHQLPKQLVVIADKPGMGKSTLLKKMAQLTASFKWNDSRPWIIFMSLENYKQPLMKLTNLNDLVSVIEFFSKIECSELSHIDCAKILNYLLKRKDRVAFFFDGMDEIPEDLQDKVKKIVKVLLKYTKAKVWIASRRHLQSSLENYFHKYIHTTRPLEQPEREKFLTKFWAHHEKLPNGPAMINSSEWKILETYADHLLKKLNDAISTFITDRFIGVPLQLFMVATVSLSQLLEYYSRQHKEEDIRERSQGRKYKDKGPPNPQLPFEDVFELYQLFVKEKFRIALDKRKLMQLRKFNPWYYNTLIEAMSQLHRKISFEFLFPNQEITVKAFPIGVAFPGASVYDGQMIEKGKEYYAALEDVGIVYHLKQDWSSIKFIHRTLAEFFVADFIVHKLIGNQTDYQQMFGFLQRHFFLPEFDNIRYFMDHLIANLPNMHEAYKMCLDWQAQKSNLESSLQKQRFERKHVDILGRTILHYAMVYGDHHEGILWCIAQNCHLIEIPDNFGSRFLGYMVLLAKSSNLRLNPYEFQNALCTLSQACRDKYRDMGDFDLEKSLDWILWFGGGKAQDLRHNLTYVQSHDCKTPGEYLDDLEEIQPKTINFLDIFKFKQIPFDLMAAAMRGDHETEWKFSAREMLKTFRQHLKTVEQFVRHCK